MKQRLDRRAILGAKSTTDPKIIPLRGPSGRLYGYLDTRALTLEVKHDGKPPEVIDLKPYLVSGSS